MLFKERRKILFDVTASVINNIVIPKPHDYLGCIKIFNVPYQTRQLFVSGHDAQSSWYCKLNEKGDEMLLGQIFYKRITTDFL